jgi:hypothetical protein
MAKALGGKLKAGHMIERQLRRECFDLVVEPEQESASDREDEGGGE